MITLNSSCIRAVGYDPFTGDLDVLFQSGRTYTHPGVPVAVYLGLVNATSPGNYYNTYIRGRYR